MGRVRRSLQGLFRLTRVCLGSCLLVLILLGTVEAGLQFRSWLDRQGIQLPPPDSGRKVNILMIGDSVLGIGDKAITATAIQKELDRFRPGTFAVINRSAPANSSGRVAGRMNSYLSRYHPAVVVLLLGMSDLEVGSRNINRGSSGPLLTYLHRILPHLKLFRYYLLISDRIRVMIPRLRALVSQWYAEHSPISPAPHRDPAANLYYLLHIKKDYPTVWNRLIELRKNPTALATPVPSCLTSARLSLLAVLMQKTDQERYLNEAKKCARKLRLKNQDPNLLAKVDILLGDAYEGRGTSQLAEYYYLAAAHADPDIHLSLLKIAWLRYGRSDWPMATQAFEKALINYPSYRRALWALFGCYNETGDYSRGISYFSQLLERSREKELLRQFILVLKLQSDPENKNRSLPREILDPSDRDSYLTALWVDKQLHRSQDADHLYISSDRFNVAHDSVLDEKNYRAILKKVTRQGGLVLALQYPNEPDWRVARAAALMGPRVKFMSLRDVFIRQLPDHPVFDLFDDDFIHVTPTGARILGKAIAGRIEKLAASTRGK